MSELDISGLKQVGEFSNTYLNQRRLVRSAKNPMDKCTIVSIYPKEINELKVTIEPGKFHIDPGTYEKPSILVVGASSWWKELDLQQPMLEFPVSSIQIAESVIKDYCNGMLGCDMSSAMPGLFFALGELNVMEIKMKYKSKIEETNKKQNNWFDILIRLADSLWARTNGNPLVIMDDMRIAARALNMEHKPWYGAFEAPKMDKCKYCGNLRNPLFPICPSCRAIDMDNPLAKEIKFAVA